MESCSSPFNGMSSSLFNIYSSLATNTDSESGWRKHLNLLKWKEWINNNKMRIRLEGLHAWLQLDCLSVSVLHISVVFMSNLSLASLPRNPSQLPHYRLPPHSRAQLWRTSATTTRQTATVAQVMTTTRQVLTSPSWDCTSAPPLTFLPYSSPTHTRFIWLSLCCSQIWYCRFSAIVCTHACSHPHPQQL